MLIYYRAWFLRYLGWAAVAAVPWIAFNFWIYGELLPPYYAASRLAEPGSFADGLLGSLFSPSRGLLTTTPVMIFAISGFVLSLREREQRPLHIAYTVIAVAIILIVASWSDWSGGHAFGPRLLTDVVPFLSYFVAFNFQLASKTSPRRQMWLSGCVMLFAAVGILIHAQGAARTGPSSWNWYPTPIA